MVWVLGAIACLVCIGFIVRPILAPRTVDIGAAAKDLALYKDQLREVDSDLARGVLSNDDAESARLEISRRILGADKRAQLEVGGAKAPAGANKAIAVIIALAVLGGGLGIYAGLGNPSLPDLPLAQRMADAKAARDQRPSQEDVEARIQDEQIEVEQAYLDLVVQLRKAVERNPDDEQGLRLLALHEFRLGEYQASRKAQTRVMEIIGDKASAKDFVDFAEIMIVATNGYVSPQAEAALGKAIQMNARDGRARYYSGLTMAQNGRPDVAYRLWEGLLEEGPADAPWIPLIQSQISDVARAAGIAVADPNAPGPTADQVEAASEMSESDRQEMIRGMVSGLGQRLATEGGTVDEWARLVRALGVLGETARASAIWKEAQTVFAGQPAALAILREAAQAAEVAQ
jgi:cytochrome c-type biogenesis protein CcmH